MSLGTDLETFAPEPTKPDPPPGYTIFQRAVSVDHTPSDHSPTANSDVDIYEIPTSSNPRPFPRHCSVSSRRSSGSLHDCVIAEQPYETMTNGSSSRPGSSVYGSPNSNPIAEQQYETMTNSTSSRPGSVYGSPHLNDDEQHYEIMTNGAAVHSTTSDQQYEIMTNGENGFVLDDSQPVAVKQHYEMMANGDHSSPRTGSLYDNLQSAKQEMTNGDHSSSRPGSLYDTPRSAKQHYEMMTNSSSRPASLYDTPRSAKQTTNGDHSSSRPGSLYDTPRSAKQHYQMMSNGDQPPMPESTYDVPRSSSNHVGQQAPTDHCRLSTSSSSPPQTPSSDYTNVTTNHGSPASCGQERKFSREHTYYENVKLPRRSSGSPPSKHQRTVISPQEYNCSVSLLNGDYIPVSIDASVHPQYEQAGGHLNGKQRHGYEWSNGDFRNTTD